MLAALVSDLSATQDYPEGCNAHIFPDGLFRSDDGRPARDTEGKVQDWRMDATIAADLIAAFKKSGKPILYDYEHNSFFSRDSVAAGWIVDLVYVAGRGLFAKVEWVDDAAYAIGKKKYRYSSPVFYYDATGRITQLVSVALTNNPALGDLGAVALVRQAALSSSASIGELAQRFLTAAGRIPGNPEGETSMTPEQIAALTAERDTLKTNLATLTGERDKAVADLAALRKTVDDQRAAADEAQRKALLTAALTDGRVPPALKEWAEKQPLAALTEYLDAQKPLALLTKQADGKPTDGSHGLTPDELAACKRMNVKPEDYLAAKKS